MNGQESKRAEKRAEFARRGDPEGWHGSHCLRPFRLPLGKKEMLAIARHAAPDEAPWLLLVTAYGVLAGFEDRLVVVKTGALNSLVAGSFFGAREAVIGLADITGIEYNSDLLTGFLEILTHSYPRTATSDRSRNMRASKSAGDSAWSLPNTLPLTNGQYKKLAPALQELRRRIATARALPAPAPPYGVGGSSLTEELSQLSNLHTNGLLTDAEFAAAKARLLS